MLERTVAAKIKLKPIADLKTAIGINERFLIISEIFKGDQEAFNAFIDHINKQCTSHEEALNYIQTQVRTKYNWNVRSGVVYDLCELIERRFL